MWWPLRRRRRKRKRKPRSSRMDMLTRELHASQFDFLLHFLARELAIVEYLLCFG
jgi:hypothetical protein